MPSNPPKNNPYADAAGTNDENMQKDAPDQRELEARVLLKSAKMISDLQDNWEQVNPETLEETLNYNHQIWLMFYRAALQNPEGNRPHDLRSNIINLANFIFKRQEDIAAMPDKSKLDKAKLDVLVNINQEIAAGLMAQAEE